MENKILYQIDNYEQLKEALSDVPVEDVIKYLVDFFQEVTNDLLKPENYSEGGFGLGCLAAPFAPIIAPFYVSMITGAAIKQFFKPEEDKIGTINKYDD